MQDASSIDVTQRLRILMKGDNGAGKSIAASSFPKPFFLFFEERWLSLITYWENHNPEKLKEIKWEYVGNSSLYAIDNIIKGVLARPEFGTIVLDSLTSAGDSLVDILRDTRTEGGKKIAGIQVNVGEDFSAEDSQIRQWRKTFFQYPGHVIWIAHVLAVDQTNMMTGKTLTSREMVTGAKKLAKKLPVYFNEAWHFNVENNKYTFITKHSGNDWAKTSLPLDEKIDFTDGSAYDAVMANLNNHKEVLAKVNAKAAELKARTKSF